MFDLVHTIFTGEEQRVAVAQNVNRFNGTFRFKAKVMREQLVTAFVQRGERGGGFDDERGDEGSDVRDGLHADALDWVSMAFAMRCQRSGMTI